MNKVHFLSTRTVASLAVGLVAGLSLTVVATTRLNFSAATDQAPNITLDFSPSNVGTTPDSAFSTAVQLSADQEVAWESLELVVNYDSTYIKIGSVALAPGWKLSSSQPAVDKLSIVLEDLATKPSQQTAPLNIFWQALSQGETKISLTSVKASFPVIGQSTATPTSLREKSISVSLAEQYRGREQVGSNSFKVTESPRQALISPRSALFSFAFDEPTAVTIRYGNSTDVSSQIGSASARYDQLLKIEGLEPDSKYYYQISTQPESAVSETLNQVKTFSTPRISTGLPIYWQALISPSRPTNLASVYLLALDESGRAVGGLAPLLSTDQTLTGLEFGQFREKSGYYQGTIALNSEWKNLTVDLSDNNTTIAKVALEADEGQSVATPTASEAESYSTLQIALAGGAICLSGLLLLFRYFARLK